MHQRRRASDGNPNRLARRVIAVWLAGCLVGLGLGHFLPMVLWAVTEAIVAVALAALLWYELHTRGRDARERTTHD